MMFKILGGSALRIVFGIMVLAALLLAGGAGAVTEISACGTISSPGEYALTQSIVSSADSYCINITSSDVIFDGTDYTIDAIARVSYPPNTYGIYVYSQTTALTNVTVKNLNVTDWKYGIYYQNAQNGAVENILLTNNSNGITLIGGSNNNSLSSNVLSNNGNGIAISFSSSNRLTGNAVSDNTNGISLSSSNYNNLTGNAVSNNSWGISLYDSDNNDLIGNTVSNNNVGVAFTFSSNNDLSGNIASNNDIGMEIMFSSNDNNLTGNAALNNTGGGISVYLSSNNNLTNNNVLNNNMDSIDLENSNNNLISENNVSNNLFGIQIFSSDNNMLRGNNISYNGNIDKALCCNFSFSALNIGGILVYSSDGNRLFGNNVSYNAHGNITAERPWAPVNKGGIILAYSTNTTLNDSIALNNSNFSIYLDGSENNTIYNNVFNNTNNAFDNGNNTWNTTRQPGTNIIGGSYLGGNFWSDYTGSDTDGDRLGDTLIPYNNSGFIQNGGDFLPLTLALGVTQNVNGGDTVTTDINNIGTSPSNPVITQVTSPIGGTVTIQESPTTQTAPGGFSFLSQEVNISAPPATPLSPLKIVFTVNSTQLGGRDQNTIQIFKNGNQVGECPGSAVANPDPCISARATLANGDVQITVLSSNGDPWNIAVPITSTAITSSVVASSSNPSLFGQSITFTATVTANSPASEMPTGTVRFIDSGVTIGTGTLNATGQAVFSTFSLSVGQHEITAVYSGDGSFASSASPVLTQTVIYGFTGFFQPVDNLPLWNSVKAGSAVPVKFSLGGNRGLDIFATGYPASQSIDCDSSAPTDAIEETITAGSSGLSYNATTDQYVYVWKTDKAWAGTCRQLDVKLNDGTDHRANINLLK